MTDKEKFRKEVERLKSNLVYGACSSQIAMETRCKEEAYNDVIAILDSSQEEPAPKVFEDMPLDDDMPLDPNIQYASREIGIKAHAEDYSFNIESELFQQLNKEQQELWRKEIEQACMSGGYCGLNLGLDKRYDKEEPVSEDLEEASLEYFKQALKDGNKTKLDAFKAGANWQEKRLLPMIDKICGMCQKQQDFINSKDLGELISTLSKRYPEVSFAKLSRIAVRVAKWQKQHTVSMACQWLDRNVTFIHPRKGTEECIINLNKFKEAMIED